MLTHAVTEMANDKTRVGSICHFLRGIVPLPHNEAYQLLPFGKVQNCFMLGLDPKSQKAEDLPPDTFWKVMGRAISRNLTRQ